VAKAKAGLLTFVFVCILCATGRAKFESLTNVMIELLVACLVISGPGGGQHDYIKSSVTMNSAASASRAKIEKTVLSH
jgi:hypothetical protein